MLTAASSSHTTRTGLQQSSPYRSKRFPLATLVVSTAAFAISCTYFSTHVTVKPLLVPASPSPTSFNALCLLGQATSLRYLLDSPSQLNFCRQMSSRSAAAKLAPGWDPVARPFPPAHRSDNAQVFKSAAKGEVKVERPYDWLETPPSESKETQAWVSSQAEYTQLYAKGCKDRDEMKKRLQANLDYARYSPPSRTGREAGQAGKYYYTYNSGLDPQTTYYQATYEELLQAEKATYTTPPGQKWFDQNVSCK